MSWGFERLKAEVYDLLRRVQVLETSPGSGTGSVTAADVSVTPTETLEANNVQSALEELQVEIITVQEGNFVLPFYSPTISSDPYGSLGSMCYDNDFLYIKTTDGWKKITTVLLVEP